MTLHRLLTTSSLCVLPLLGAGCSWRAGAPQAPSSRASHGDHVVSMVQRAQPAPDNGPHDAPPALPVVFQMDIYRLDVPFGTFCRNEDFWKRMDEECVDPATKDLLERNGIRVGQAPQAELKFFQKFIDDKPVMQRLSTMA